MNLTEIPFKEPEKAEKIFQEFYQPAYYNEFLQSVNNRLLELLKNSVDPDMAIINIDRFFNAYTNRSSLYSLLQQVPASMELMIKLCGQSQFSADVLVRNPELFTWLMEEGQLDEKKTKERYLDEIEEELSPIRSYVRKMNSKNWRLMPSRDAGADAVGRGPSFTISIYSIHTG